MSFSKDCLDSEVHVVFVELFSEQLVFQLVKARFPADLHVAEDHLPQLLELLLQVVRGEHVDDQADLLLHVLLAPRLLKHLARLVLQLLPQVVRLRTLYMRHHCILLESGVVLLLLLLNGALVELARCASFMSRIVVVIATSAAASAASPAIWLVTSFHEISAFLFASEQFREEEGWFLLAQRKILEFHECLFGIRLFLKQSNQTLKSLDFVFVQASGF